MKRDRIFQRDRLRCVYCGMQFPAEELTLDHVEARVHGGDRSEGNLVAACGACNTLKGQRRVSDFLRDSDVARKNFFRYAVHVWPRILRTLQDQVEAPREAMRKRRGRR